MTLQELESIATGLAPVMMRAVTVATAPLIKRIEDLEARQPVHGEKGDPGEPGQDGASVSPEDIEAMIARAVASAMEALPRPADGKDGRDGSDGADGVPGLDGEKGDPGADGRDGCDATDAMIDQDGNLVVVFSDGRSKAVGKVVGRDGMDGQKGDAGRDGLSVTNFDANLSEDGRFLTLSLENDEARVEHRLQMPTLIYRGAFREGVANLPGDMVTFGGSLWHCKAVTTDKPIEGKDCWQLAARKGRDGKDAKP